MKTKKIKKIILVLILSFSSSCALMFNEGAVEWDLVGGDSAKSIIKFEVLGKEASIENNKITYTFQCDFDSSSLVNVGPEIDFIGSSIYPSKDTEVDLTDKFNYLVVAEDGSSKKYEVDIKIAPASSKEIFKFNIAYYVGEIDDINKTITFDIEDEEISGIIDFEISGKKLIYDANEIEKNSGFTFQFNKEIFIYNCEDNYDTYTFKNNSRSGSFDLSQVSISPSEASVFETFPNTAICKSFDITNPNTNSIDLDYSFLSQTSNFYKPNHYCPK